ncbi:uncharacterized protein [Physcomitrium patens]|uniref:C2 domain-containing protein n=1 Tax=Physcomitrium patens TaxID=3218 RepID=A0A2K1JVW4_PHYPA|nr:C2 domain-containing protein At1g53590-like isoform X1 [Physcomitrium patens]PNR45663.1 hypothetical protein PHYPA_015434 [Physcomitrium patens]|eukprot:XP_024389724.1 C2 domain-containing protein At1g53590-like isoform X1 [Physcomitrella patens]
MGNPAQGEPSFIAEKTMDQFLLMFYVVSVMCCLWIVSSVSSNCLFLSLLGGYLFWILKQCLEREKREILFEERKRVNASKAMTEGETLQWLNESLNVMWPICMEKFASQHFFTPIAPWFLKKFKPKYVKEVTLQSLHLGSTSPLFSLIRVLPASQDDDVIFEAEMEFSSDKDMKAQMSVQMKHINTTTTFYISKLYIKGTVKFSVKFEKGWPILGRVRFCFANAPYIDMTARPYAKKGIDMRIIPGAASWLEETLGTALEQSVVEPYMLVIDMKKLVSNMMFPGPISRYGLQDFFSVEHKSGVMVLVEVLEAGELKAGNAAGLPDPMVELLLGTRREITKPKLQTVNPVWTREMHRMPIVNWEYPNILTLRVMSKPSWGRSVDLGICSIAVKEFQNGERKEKKLRLESVNKKEYMGWIKFAITVEHHNGSQTPEERHTTFGSQPQTQEIASITPPESTATSRSQALGTRIKAFMHMRNSSTEVETAILVRAATSEPSEIDGGSTDIIEMPSNIPPGSFSIQCPEKEETSYFTSDPRRRSNAKKHKKDKSAPGCKERDAIMSNTKVKTPYMRFLRMRKPRNISKISFIEKSPADREATMTDLSGYSSSMEHSSEVKVCTDSSKTNMQLFPDMAHAVHNIIHEKTIIDSCNATTQLQGNSQQQTIGRDFVENLSFSNLQDEVTLRHGCRSQSATAPMPPKQYTKNNSWLRNFKLTKWPKKSRKTMVSKQEHVSVDNLERDPASLPRFEHEFGDPSYTSTTLSIRKELPPTDLKTALLQAQSPLTGSLLENHRSILASGRPVSGSQSCRQDASILKRILPHRAQSFRFDLLNITNRKHARLE